MAGSGSIGGGNQQIDEFRKEVNRVHIHLIEFSLLGETVLEWDETDLEDYHAKRIELTAYYAVSMQLIQLRELTMCVAFRG